MTNIALIESKTSRTNWEERFDNNFEIDRYALCSDSSKKKILKGNDGSGLWTWFCAECTC